MNLAPYVFSSGVAIFQQLLDPLSSSWPSKYPVKPNYIYSQTIPKQMTYPWFPPSITRSTSFTTPPSPAIRNDAINLTHLADGRRTPKTSHHPEPLPVFPTVFSRAHSYVVDVQDQHRMSINSQSSQHPQTQQHSPSRYSHNKNWGHIFHSRKAPPPFYPAFLTVTAIGVLMGYYIIYRHPERFVNPYLALYEEDRLEFQRNLKPNNSQLNKIDPESNTTGLNKTIIHPKVRQNIANISVNNNNNHKNNISRYNSSVNDFKQARDWFS